MRNSKHVEKIQNTLKEISNNRCGQSSLPSSNDLR